MISGLRVALSTVLLMVVEVVHNGASDAVVVGVGMVMEDVARSATLLTISPAKSVNTAVTLATGLTVVTMGTTSAVAVALMAIEAMVVAVAVASDSSKILEG